MAGKRSGKQQKFEFEFQGKKYVIHGRYAAQPATIVLSDGQILQVQTWQLGVPFEPVPSSVGTFDPQKCRVAELAAAAGGFVAELVQAAPQTTATIDDEILKNLILETQEMIKSLQVKGTTKFSESAETGMLRVSIVSLIGELQFYGVLPVNFHVANGTVVTHL